MAKWQRVRSYSYSESKQKRSSLQGPLRVIRLCVLSILFPGLLLSIPLYMRNHVYIQQAYPMGMSDIRLLDKRVSTMWCQRQVIWSNATYNAFLMEDQPELTPDRVKVSMTRRLVLEDDMKEYWGFYLLKGSVVTVSTCVRWPGASLIMIKGHTHLKQCAYIGDDSSEEFDEMFNGEESNNTSTDYDISNKPTNMKKISDGVLVEEKESDHVDISSVNHHQKQHFHASAVEAALKNHWKIDNKKGSSVHLIFAEEIINPKRTKEKDEYKVNPVIVNLPEEGDEQLDKTKTSKEVYDKMLQQLRKMGHKGKTILERLHDNLTKEETGLMNKNNLTENTELNLKELPPLRISANITQFASLKQSPLTRRKKRRHIPTIGRSATQLTEQDVEEDNAAEEEDDLQPDGAADIHGKLNQTTDNDQSKSEFWSSFSSSEERLLECEGLLLNLPLTPNHMCEATQDESVLARASGPNTVSYTVPSNGYYFFVFNSENEIQPNFIRTHFRLEKTTYNVSGAVASCHNQTGSCSLPLRFWSNDKVIIELPVSTNDTLWNEEFLTVTTCEPRTAVYVACIVAMPLLIVLFAFQ